MIGRFVRWLLHRQTAQDRFLHIDRDSVPEMGDQEVAELEQVLNAALSGKREVLFIRGEDGELREET